MPPRTSPIVNPAGAHGCFLIVATLCLGAFGWMLTFGTFRFGDEDVFGSFYDYQAQAWLKGRWDVPEPALSGEAFVVDGKVYGYFGPTPALMRLPLAALGIGSGRVTRVYMMFDYALCLVGAYALLCQAARWRDRAASPANVSIALFTLSVGLGSTLFFLGSRAYVYHEAILCGAAFALWGTVLALRHLHAPQSRAWIGSLACGVLAIHARPPIGLFALSVLGCAALGAIGKPSAPTFGAGLRRAVTIVLLAGLGVLSFNAVSYLKFGTFEGCPLWLNVQYTPEKLAVLENRNFHLSNLRFNTDAYLLRPSFSVSRSFPYFYREFIDRKKYPESKMAYRDQTLAMPWSMPGLFAFATAGSLLAAACVPAFRRPLGVLWVAALPATAAMLTAVAVTQRYEADFCPFLAAAAAFGIVSIETIPDRARRATLAIAAVLTLLGVLITGALTIHHQREIVWGVPDDVRRSYQDFRVRVDAWLGPEQRH